MIPLIAFIEVAFYLSHIFISRESKLEKKQRSRLYILIGMCYLLIAVLIYTRYFNLEVMRFYLDNALLTVYLVLVAIYINSIFRAAK